jgi:branched-subunit amino acid transport protein AzlD
MLKWRRKNKTECENSTQENTRNVRYLSKGLCVSGRFLRKRNMLMWCYKAISANKITLSEKTCSFESPIPAGAMILLFATTLSRADIKPTYFRIQSLPGAHPLCINIVFSESGMYKIHTFWSQQCHYSHYGFRSLTAVGILCADHVTPSIRKRWH